MKHRCVNGKMREARIGMISASLMVTMIMVMSQTAIAANHIVEVTGFTTISVSDCEANVTSGPPGSLVVTNGDDVTIYYNYTYDDSRPSGWPNATHQFVLIVDGWAKEEAHFTFGNESGFGTIQKTVYNVQKPGQIWVALYTNISCPGQSCYDWDWDGRYIILK